MATASAQTNIPDFVWDDWRGLNTMTKNAEDLKKGYSPDALNWITEWDDTAQHSDHIELRRGMALLGDRKTGSTNVMGLGVGTQDNGTQVPFWTDGATLYYYNASTSTSVSVMSLPAAAANDWFSIEPINGIEGNFIEVSSFNSSMYRIPVSNPTSYIDVNSGQVASGTVRGFLNLVNSRMNLWQKNGNQPTSANKTDYFISQVDFQTYGPTNSLTGPLSTQLPAYPTKGAAETVGTGDGSTKTFAHTLSNQQGGSVSTLLIVGATASFASITGITAANPAVITVASTTGLSVGQYILIEGVVGTMANVINDAILQITALTGTTITVAADTTTTTWSSGGTVYTVEYFTDDRNGSLASNAGGTGTVNYGTGAISVTFKTAPLNGVTVACQYYYWAPLAGVEKFAPDGTIGASTAYIWPQRDAGGPLQTIQPLAGQNYCFHLNKTWVETTDPNSASSSTNLPYRNNIGVPFYKAAWPTGDGIIFIDNSIPAHPRFQILAIPPNSTASTIEPIELGRDIDFSLYAFDYANVFFFDHWYLIFCQSYVNGVKRTFNDTAFLYDNRSGFWSRVDYPVAALAQYLGTLIGGLSVSPNIYTLFSGFDDDGSTISNYWLSSILNLDFKGLKSTQRFVIEGLMQTSQSLDIYVSYDRGSFTKVQTINGTDPCVSKGNPQLVGNNTIGSQSIGAGSVYANPYLLEFRLASPFYQYIQVKFVATGIGYIQIDQWSLKTNHAKSLRVQPANTLQA